MTRNSVFYRFGLARTTCGDRLHRIAFARFMSDAALAGRQERFRRIGWGY